MCYMINVIPVIVCGTEVSFMIYEKTGVCVCVCARARDLWNEVCYMTYVIMVCGNEVCYMIYEKRICGVIQLWGWSVHIVTGQQ